MLKTPDRTLSAITRLLDVATLAGAGAVAYLVRFRLFEGYAELSDYIACGLGGILLASVCLPLAGAYTGLRGEEPYTLVRRALLGWVAAFVVLLLILAAAQSVIVYSRAWLAGWAILGAGGLIAVRALIRGLARWAHRRGLTTQRVLLFGAGDLGARVVDALAHRPGTGFEPVCVFDDDVDKEGATIGHLRVRTDTQNLVKAVSELDIDELWLALPLRAEQRVHEILHELRHEFVNVRLMPDIFGLRLLNHSMTEIAGIGTINLSETPLSGGNRLVKEIEDRVVAAIILVLISPLLLAIAAGVKLSSPGPVLYRQERLGWNGRPFKMLKFRSMRTDAEDSTGATWAQRQDPRTTRLGRFLRRTSLDELPQFINVLRGDMSIVGPRPERPEFVEHFKDEIPRYMEKHLVKAGITGWAQIHGLRGNTDLNKRIEYDLYYIENWSLLFDLEIIVRTVFRAPVDPNAY